MKVSIGLVTSQVLRPRKYYDTFCHFNDTMVMTLSVTLQPLDSINSVI
jgi:hypothetical protein